MEPKFTSSGVLIEAGRNTQKQSGGNSRSHSRGEGGVNKLRNSAAFKPAWGCGPGKQNTGGMGTSGLYLSSGDSKPHRPPRLHEMQGSGGNYRNTYELAKYLETQGQGDKLSKSRLAVSSVYVSSSRDKPSGMKHQTSNLGLRQQTTSARENLVGGDIPKQSTTRTKGAAAKTREWAQQGSSEEEQEQDQSEEEQDEESEEPVSKYHQPKASFKGQTQNHAPIRLRNEQWGTAQQEETDLGKGQASVLQALRMKYFSDKKLDDSSSEEDRELVKKLEKYKGHQTEDPREQGNSGLFFQKPQSRGGLTNRVHSAAVERVERELAIDAYVRKDDEEHARRTRLVARASRSVSQDGDDSEKGEDGRSDDDPTPLRNAMPRYSPTGDVVPDIIPELWRVWNVRIATSSIQDEFAREGCS